MDIKLGKHEQKLVDTAAAFAREVVAPDAARWEEERRVPREALDRAAEAGLSGLLAPREMASSSSSVAVSYSPRFTSVSPRFVNALGSKGLCSIA